MTIEAFGAEVMLLGWKMTHNGGAEIRLLLQSEEDLEHFKAMTVAKGKTAGQILMAAFSEVGEDGQPKQESKKLGALSQWCVIRCKEEAFQSFLKEEFPISWMENESLRYPEAIAKAVVCKICRIITRTALDSDERAAETFNSEIRIPYSKLHEQG